MFLLRIARIQSAQSVVLYHLPSPFNLLNLWFLIIFLSVQSVCSPWAIFSPVVAMTSVPTRTSAETSVTSKISCMTVMVVSISSPSRGRRRMLRFFTSPGLGDVLYESCCRKTAFLEEDIVGTHRQAACALRLAEVRQVVHHHERRTLRQEFEYIYISKHKSNFFVGGEGRGARGKRIVAAAQSFSLAPCSLPLAPCSSKLFSCPLLLAPCSFMCTILR